MRKIIARSRAAVASVLPAVALGVALAGCGVVDSVKDTLFGGGSGPQSGQPGYVSGFIGNTVAGEPRAALLGRDVLSGGGTAADAVVAMGFGLNVTLPSRAGLGGGGVCVAYAPDTKSANGGVPETILFVPLAPKTGGGDRPAALPLMARGLYALHARYGSLPFEGLVQRAEYLARNGVPASRAFVNDLNLVAGPLFADPTARSIFSRNGKPVSEGQSILQPELAATLAQMRQSGVGDFYQGALARRIIDASAQAGGPLTAQDLRGALPGVSPVLVVPYGKDQVGFAAVPADGGLAAAAAFQVLAKDPNDMGGAAARGLAVAARWRAGGINENAVLASTDLPPAALPALPASTTFGAVDRRGNAVMCAATMGNLFGTGRVLSGLGFLQAASPAMFPPPLLSVGLAWHPKDNAFHAAAGGSGQAGAPLAVAAGLLNALRSGKPMVTQVPDPGRVNVLSCARYLSGNEDNCAAATDPRDSGLATGGG